MGRNARISRAPISRPPGQAGVVLQRVRGALKSRRQNVALSTWDSAQAPAALSWIRAAPSFSKRSGTWRREFERAVACEGAGPSKAGQGCHRAAVCYRCQAWPRYSDTDRLLQGHRDAAASLSTNQRMDRVAQPGAIIPPVLELPQAAWRQSTRVCCRDARRSIPRAVGRSRNRLMQSTAV